MATEAILPSDAATKSGQNQTPLSDCASAKRESPIMTRYLSALLGAVILRKGKAVDPRDFKGVYRITAPRDD